MKRLNHSLLLLAAALAFCAPAGAAGPKVLHYETKVLDANHQPLAGVVVERYRLPGFFGRADGSLSLEERATSDRAGMVSFTSTNGGVFLLFAHKPGLAVSWSMWLPGFPAAELGETGELVLTAPTFVCGVVKDAAGHPVPKAPVWVSGAFLAGNRGNSLPLSAQLGRKFLATRSGSKGEFRIEGLPAGASVDLAASKAGLAVDQPSRVAFGAESLPFQAGQSDAVLTLKPAGALAGRVVREDTGAPLAGARLSIGENEWNEDLATALTGADGRFLLPDLPPGEYKVQAAVGASILTEWVCEEVVATVEAGKTNQDLKLSANRGGVLEVALRDAAGQPATDAIVGVSRELRNQLGFVSADGIALFRLTPGDYEMFAFAEEKKGQQSRITVTQNETNRLELTLEAAPHLEGVVLAPDGKPAPGVKVLFLPFFPMEKKTDNQGRFKLAFNQLGEMGEQQRYVLARDLAHNLAASVELDEDATNLTLRLAPGLSIIGSIADEKGKPLTNAQAQAMFRTERITETFGMPVTVDAEGRFELKALPTGRAYAVNASAKGFGQDQQNVESGENATNRVGLAPFKLPLANRRLAGRVLDANDKPVSGAWVNGNGEHQPQLTTRSDAQGRFSFEHVCAGQIQVSANSMRGSYGNVRVEAGDTNVMVQLGTAGNVANFSGSTKLTGVVRKPDGKPAAKVSVCLFPYNGTETQTDAEGRYKLSFNPQQWGGQQDVPRVLIARDLASNLAVAQEADNDATNIDLKLEPGFTLVGRVTDSAGKPIHDTTANVMFHTERIGSTLSGQTQADATGRVEFKALPIGHRYTLTASAKGYGQDSRTVQPTEAETRQVEVESMKLVLADRALAGVVLDSNDKPVAGASLYCYEDKQPHLNARTDAKGHFAFDHVCPGPIRLSVNGSRGGYASVTAEGGDTNVVVHLGDSSGARPQAPRMAHLQNGPLPDLAPLGITAADCPKEQPILAVLVDAEQRPSRRVLRQLTEQSGALKLKGVTVVVLQAGGMSPEAFAAWKQEAALPFPVGCIKGEPEKARASWGASALPWLILTDKDHKVAAEGFSMEELEAKLGAR